jgi:hypothetical protein
VVAYDCGKSYSEYLKLAPGAVVCRRLNVQISNKSAHGNKALVPTDTIAVGPPILRNSIMACGLLPPIAIQPGDGLCSSKKVTFDAPKKR